MGDVAVGVALGLCAAAVLVGGLHLTVAAIGRRGTAALPLLPVSLLLRLVGAAAALLVAGAVGRIALLVAAVTVLVARWAALGAARRHVRRRTEVGRWT